MFGWVFFFFVVLLVSIVFFFAESRSYQFKVLTGQSESEVITVRLSQNAVHRALEETFRNSNIGDIYHGSEITAVKVGNNSKRSFENYIGGERNLTSEDEMAFDVLVHIADDGHVSSEDGLRAILESPIRDTKLPLGAEVKVGKRIF